jgi:hypothetical protein
MWPTTATAPAGAPLSGRCAPHCRAGQAGVTTHELRGCWAEPFAPTPPSTGSSLGFCSSGEPMPGESSSTLSPGRADRPGQLPVQRGGRGSPSRSCGCCAAGGVAAPAAGHRRLLLEASTINRSAPEEMRPERMVGLRSLITAPSRSRSPPPELVGPVVVDVPGGVPKAGRHEIGTHLWGDDQRGSSDGAEAEQGRRLQRQSEARRLAARSSPCARKRAFPGRQESVPLGARRDIRRRHRGWTPGHTLGRPGP